MTKCIQIHPDDNVAVALHPVAKGEEIELGGVRVTAAEDIRRATSWPCAPSPRGRTS